MSAPTPQSPSTKIAGGSVTAGYIVLVISSVPDANLKTVLALVSPIVNHLLNQLFDFLKVWASDSFRTLNHKRMRRIAKKSIEAAKRNPSIDPSEIVLLERKLADAELTTSHRVIDSMMKAAKE